MAGYSCLFRPFTRQQPQVYATGHSMLLRFRTSDSRVLPSNCTPDTILQWSLTLYGVPTALLLANGADGAVCAARLTPSYGMVGWLPQVTFFLEMLKGEPAALARPSRS
jgi:hypothetical protein